MKLLNITVRNYALLSLLVVLIGIPVFHLIIGRLYREDIDEELLMRKEEVVRRLNRLQNEAGLALLDQVDDELSIRPVGTVKPQDSYYDTIDTLASELEPFRVLSTHTYIQGKPYQLLLRRSMVESEDLIKGVAQTQAVLLVLLLGSLVLLNQLFSRRLWRPFYHTVEQLKKFELDKHSTFAPEQTNIQEFNDLNQTILHLTEKNQLVYQSQKQFTENASHEIQTPLAILEGKLELLMQTPELTERQAELIASAMQVTSRMSRLNKNLLLLSKIENQQFFETRTIQADYLLQQVLEQYDNHLDAKSLQLQQTIEPVTLTTNHTLLEILFSNLISNAIRHNLQGGSIRIRLSSKTLMIENTGKSLSVLPEKMFERFRKESSAINSVGLGLSIVKQICDVCHFSIQYTNDQQLHRIEIFF